MTLGQRTELKMVLELEDVGLCEDGIGTSCAHSIEGELQHQQQKPVGGSGVHAAALAAAFASTGRGPTAAATMTASSSKASTQLDHAVHLLLDPKAAGLHERHAASIARLGRHAAAAGGFAVSELPRVALLLDVTLRLVAASSAAAASFASPVCELLRLLERPPVKHALTDEVRLPAGLEGLLGVLRSALLAADELPAQLQSAVARLLETVAAAYGNRPSVLELQTAWAAGRTGQQPAAPAGVDGAAWSTYHLHQR